MIKPFFTLLVILTCTVAYGQPTDEAQIRATLNDYIAGSSNTRPKQIKKAFSKNATLYLTNKEGEFQRYTPHQYTEFFKNRKEGEFNGRVGNILAIEIERDVATAKVEIIITERASRYIDLFLLKHTDEEGWKIISKTATATDFPSPIVRDETLDNFTLQRLLVQNAAGEVLMEQYESGWFPPSMYSNSRLSIREAMDSLALARGITISKLELKAYPTYKFAFNDRVSFRSYFVADYTKGTLLKPTDALAIAWMPITEVLSTIPVEAIRLITKQILEFPNSVWGGSFLISENGELHETTILEEFYPLFENKE